MTLATTAAGTDAASGRKRLVVPLRVGPAVHGEEDEECVPHELWLVTESAGAFEIEQLLLAGCSRSTAWPDELKVNGDEVSFDTSDIVPSNWFGRSEVLSFDLSWPSFSGIAADYGFKLSHCPEDVTSSFDRGFTNHVTWRRTRKNGSELEGIEDVCTERRSYVPIPIIALPPEFEASGFRTLPFDGCSSAIEGTGGASGIAVSGATAGAADATFHVVLSKQDFLYLDIVDDHFMGPSGDPSADDHLEIWTAPETYSYMSRPDAAYPKPGRFGIRVADGRVFGAESAAAPVSVEREERQGHVILRIGLPGAATRLEKSEIGGLSVAYVDADPGEPRAVVATSRADAGTAESLGIPQAVHKGVTCRIDGGELVRSAPAKGREQPLYGP